MIKVIRRVVATILVTLVASLAVLMCVTNNSYVRTPSMYPTIPPGSQIFVSRESTYHVGDVIEFRANGLVWAHRLVRIEPDGSYVTKGDNPQNAPDVFVPAVTKHDVIGRVTHAPRWLGFPQFIAQHPGEALSWLRAELGLTGKVGLLLVVAALTVAVTARRRRAPAPARRVGAHRREPVHPRRLSRVSGSV